MRVIRSTSISRNGPFEQFTLIDKAMKTRNKDSDDRPFLLNADLLAIRNHSYTSFQAQNNQAADDDLECLVHKEKEAPNTPPVISTDGQPLAICPTPGMGQDKNQRVRIQPGAKDDAEISSTPSSVARRGSTDTASSKNGSVKSHRRSQSAPVQVQIIMTGPQPGVSAQPFRKDSPRFVCCGLHITAISRFIAYIELVISIILLIACIAGGMKAFSVPATGMIIGGVAVIIVGALVAALVLLGLKKHGPSWLIPYLVVKGFQMGAVGLALFISILGLLGFTTLFGIVAATTSQEYTPPSGGDFGGSWIDYGAQNNGGGGSGSFNEDAEFGDESVDFKSSSSSSGATPAASLVSYPVMDPISDPAQAAVNNVTVVFAGIFICLLIILGFMISFFVAIFKCYRYQRECIHFSQACVAPAVTYQVVPRGDKYGTDIFIHSNSTPSGSIMGVPVVAPIDFVPHSISDPDCSTGGTANSLENLICKGHRHSPSDVGSCTTTGSSAIFTSGDVLSNGNAEDTDSDKVGTGPTYKRLKDL